MKALVQDRFGGPETLLVKDIPVPRPADDELLVRIRAASINSLDYRFMRGTPLMGRLLFGFGLRRPKRRVRGVDFAGTVEAVGPSVPRFKVGDEVFGVASGSLAELATASPEEIDLKPRNASFAQAAALPIAAVTALQALRDHGRVRAGEEVLVTGAGGGVGTFAVQIAVALGAKVTAVTSTRHVDRVRSLGASRVLDYGREDFTRSTARYDLIVDISGDRPFHACRRLLTPGGRIVPVGGRGIGRFLKAMLLARLLRYPIEGFIAKVQPAALATLRELVESGRLIPVIESEFTLGDAGRAFGLAEGHQTQGKLVVTVS
jgi:NADPH:quinone reductase-like Zn-dependent oxidoreductase